MVFKLKYILIFVAFVSYLSSYAQPVDNSPYSSFGIGNVQNDNLVYYQGFGGLGASFLDLYHLNLQNPASYSFLNATAYEVGLSSQYSRFSDESNSAGIWKGNLDYLALGFPLRNPINSALDPEKRDFSLGMSLFLKPHSTVGYDVSSEYTDPDIGEYSKNFEGNGGTYKFMWGNSLRYKSFSVGANIGYLFGNINFNENIFFPEFEFVFENRNSIDYNVNGFLWDAGLAYNWFINKSAFEKNKNITTRVLNIGMYGNSSNKFHSLSDVTEMVSFPAAGINDTLSFTSRVKGTGKLPMELGFGATYLEGSKFAIGFNIDYGAWSNYENSVREETLMDTYKLSIGGLYRPDAKSFNNYFKRVAYKFGVFYQKDPQIIDNIQITDAGLNLGASFPFYYQRKISHINAALRFGVRGNNTPISEAYGKISLGFTFNDDEWFLKRKYN